MQTATYAFTVLRRPELQTWYSFYSVSAGISIGGGAIWVMHFVGARTARARSVADLRAKYVELRLAVPREATRAPSRARRAARALGSRVTQACRRSS